MGWGLLLGIMNTVLTEAVMEATDLPRSVASSAYSAVRFIGRAVAPPVAAVLWHAFSVMVPYLFAAAAVLIATLAVLLGREAWGVSTPRRRTRPRMPRRSSWVTRLESQR